VAESGFSEITAQDLILEALNSSIKIFAGPYLSKQKEKYHDQ
jgi:hypothetical protein